MDEAALTQKYLDIAGVILLALDADGNVASLNRRGHEILEYHAGELVGKNWFETCLPERERARVTSLFRQMMAGDLPSVERLETLVVTRSGRERLVAWRVLLLADDAGRQVGVLSSGEDITDHRQTEDALRESEERFRTVVEASADAITVMTIDGRFVMANRQAARLFGVESVDELLALAPSCFDAIAPEDRPRATERIRQAITTGISDASEMCLIRRDGTRWPAELHSSVQRDSQGNPIAVITVTRDITERKRAQQRQARSVRRLEGVNRLQEHLILPGPLDEKLKKIAETAVELLDLDFCRIWNIKPADLCQNGCVHASAADQRDACPSRDKCLHLAASAGRYTRTNGDFGRVPLGCYKIGRIAAGPHKRFLTNDISTDPQVADPQWAKDLGLVAFAGHKLHNTNDDPVGVLAAFAAHPISEEDDAFLSNLAETTSKVILENQAAEELRETRATAVAADGEKSEFLANMSHEIRTPMTAILGFTDLLLSPNVPYEEQREFLETISKNGKALLKLMDDVLDLSRIEADRLSIESADCALRPLVDDVVRLVGVRAKEKGLKLEVDYDQALPELIHTDPARVRQILVNLVGNAIKFTPRGEVRIAVRALQQAAGKMLAQFAISDTGVGIHPGKIKELFRPFVQADASTTRQYGGSGLGLAISKRLAKLLGGDIDVASEPGKGSRFTLTLPAGSPRNANAPEPAIDRPASTTTPTVSHFGEAFRGRVLLAEDSPEIRRLVTQLFRRMSLELDVAENGRLACEKAALAASQGKRYDLILMDVQMPEMDGLEATRWLRDRGWQKPIVALTAHAMVGDREGCLAAGCNDYLAKPFHPKQLQAMLARYLTPTAAAGVPDAGLAPA